MVCIKKKFFLAIEYLLEIYSGIIPPGLWYEVQSWSDIRNGIAPRGV